MARKKTDKPRKVQKRVRVEDSKRYWFITVKTTLDRLWFVNNPELSKKIVAYLAKYQQVFGVELYGFILMGNHYHLSARFPRRNRARFLQAYNSVIQKLVQVYVPEFQGGQLIARNYDCPTHITNEDVEHWVFYLWANPVTTGLVSNISQYNLYNSFVDASKGREREFKIVNWTEYKNRVRFNKNLTPKDFTYTYTLKFSRLPGYEEMTAKEYEAMLVKKLKSREKEALKGFKEIGYNVGNNKTLANVLPGSRPKNPKKRKRDSHRPLVLTLSDEARVKYVTWYFNMLRAYQKASEQYQAGDLNVKFPEGTYRPVVFLN